MIEFSNDKINKKTKLKKRKKIILKMSKIFLSAQGILKDKENEEIENSVLLSPIPTPIIQQKRKCKWERNDKFKQKQRNRIDRKWKKYLTIEKKKKKFEIQLYS